MKLKTFESLTLYRFRYRIGYALLFGLGAVLMLWKLGSLVPGVSIAELASAKSSTLRAVWENPIYAPYRLLQAISLKLLGQNAWALRLPSVVFGTFSVFGVYLFLRNAYAERVAVMGSILFGVSSALLGASRYGTASISMAWTMAALLGIASWIMTATKITWWHLTNAAIVAVFALYSPLGWLWLSVIFFLHPKEVIRTIKDASNIWLALATMGFLVAISPIVLAAIRDPQIIRAWAFIPETLPSIATIATNIVRVIASLAWRNTLSDPATHLGNLPILDIFTASMTFLGVLTLIMKPALARTRILLITGGLAVAAIAINYSAESFVLLLPLAAIFTAIGLERMLEEWYEMFPRNPFARVGALIPLALVFAMTMFYQVHRGFVAWPKAPETKAAFQQRL